MSEQKIDLRRLLAQSDAVRVDGGPLLDSWDFDDAEGLLEFRWDTDDQMYLSVHDEDCLKTLEVVSPGTLRLKDIDGRDTEITLLTLNPLEDPCFKQPNHATD